MTTLITKAQHRSAVRQFRMAEQEIRITRRHALLTIAAAKSARHAGRTRLAREDQCGAYMAARAYLNQRRRQLENIRVMT